MQRNSCRAVLVLIFLSVAFFDYVWAEESPPILPEPAPGRLEGTGTTFELNNSDYLNITLSSSEPIKLVLESMPEMITMQIGSAYGASSTTITIGGLLALTTYHKYEDDYHNHVAFTTDTGGRYTYTQDLSRAHRVFIQPRIGTKFLSDDATGGDCISIGTWDSATKTCMLTTDLTETIQIDSDGIILDGNGHTLTGSNTGVGVYLSGRMGVTIKNLNVKNFNYGIWLYYSSDNILMHNALANNFAGIFLDSASNNILTGNVLINLDASFRYPYVSQNYNGIYIYYSSNNILTGNIVAKHFLGIFLYPSSSNNILKDNIVQGNAGGIVIYFSNDNNLTGNIADSSDYAGIYFWHSHNNILTDNALTNNPRGLVLHSSSYNKIYNNNFIDNSIQAYGFEGSGGNIFNLSKPIGGNYWSNFDTPDEGCNNLDGDSFCDAPYVFTGGQDNLPWTKQSGWLDNIAPTTAIILSGTLGNNNWYV